jgi:hypothetical protein
MRWALFILRSVSATVGAATLAAFGILVANPGAALAADTMGSLGGAISGGKGVKLDCGGTTVSVLDPSGKIVATGPTTPAGDGSCTFTLRVPAGVALSTCAGKIAFANDSGGMRSLYLASPPMMVNGHEQLGTIGGNHVYSTVVSIASLSGGGRATAAIAIGTEP